MTEKRDNMNVKDLTVQFSITNADEFISLLNQTRDDLQKIKDFQLKVERIHAESEVNKSNE